MGRALGSIERAAVLTEQAAPFNAVAVLGLAGRIDAEALKVGLAETARRHPLISMRPVQGRFEPCGVTEPELVEREGEEAALEAEIDLLLNDRHQARGAHPLRARLVRCADGDTVVIAAPHYLVDAASLARLTFEALGGGGDAATELSTAPIEARFAPAWRGLAALPHVAAFAARQMAVEIGAWRGRPGVATPPYGATRHVLRRLEPARAAALASACRRHGCTLYGLIAAAAARVFLGELAGRETGAVSVMSFRDLRRRVSPPVPVGEIGACFAMPRCLLKVEAASDWPAAARCSEALAESGRRGDAFAANHVAPHLIRALIATRRRAADIAVNVPTFGWPRGALAERIRSFAGYVSVLPFAPPISLVAAPSPVGLAIGFMYLDSEFTPERAQAIADAVVGRLEAAA